jgi:predicted nucleic acid-binding protein
VTAVYAESSAVLGWLLGESRQGEVTEALTGAGRVVTSAITAIECARGVARSRQMQRISRTEELAALRLLDDAALSWNVMDLSDEVAVRARAEFPLEPVRTLDAVHLATAQVFQDALGSIGMLSFDSRMCANAAALGMSLMLRP